MVARKEELGWGVSKSGDVHVMHHKKSPAKKKRLFVIPRHSKGHKGIDDDDVQYVYEAARTVEQRPAQAQHREHHQQ